VTATAPGAALRARPRAITTGAPARSPLTVAISPTSIPIRSSTCRSAASSPLRSAMPRWISRPQRTAVAASANSTRVRLGVSAKIRPP
jgi:hypothetical protein